MRVTQKGLVEEARRNITDHMERLQHLQSVLASGKRVQKPEDDPVGVERILELRAYLQGMETDLRNIGLTTDWLGATEQALQDLNEVLKRAKVISLDAANEASQSDEVFGGWIAEVDTLLQQAVQIGNSDHRGLYLFAGRKVKTAPFEMVSAPSLQVIYHGDGGSLEHEPERGVRLQVNIPGDHPLFQRVFGSLIDLRSALESRDTEGIRRSAGELDQAIDSVSEALSVVGARTNRVNATAERLRGRKLEVQRLLSDLEDADMAEAALNMNIEDQAYRAALAASARLMGPLLIDYLH